MPYITKKDLKECFAKPAKYRVVLYGGENGYVREGFQTKATKMDSLRKIAKEALAKSPDFFHTVSVIQPEPIEGIPYILFRFKREEM